MDEGVPHQRWTSFIQKWAFVYLMYVHLLNTELKMLSLFKAYTLRLTTATLNCHILYEVWSAVSAQETDALSSIQLAILIRVCRYDITKLLLFFISHTVQYLKAQYLQS